VDRNNVEKHLKSSSSPFQFLSPSLPEEKLNRLKDQNQHHTPPKEGVCP
jgi:hypothetical protein